jgi:release factor glutamine methyltransferase
MSGAQTDQTDQIDQAATWGALYREAKGRLGDNQEARWLVEEASGAPWPNTTERASERATDTATARLHAMIERRMAGEPLQYVIGRWGFRTLDLMVDQRVLIPRPETEQVTEVALGELDRLSGAGRSEARLLAVDLGTGSGAIALAVATERTGVEVWATDVSPAALEVAAVNLAGLEGRERREESAATRVRLAHGPWWSALPENLRGRIDLVVSNPPYISSDEMTQLDGQVTGWEPNLALEAGPTGLEALHDILHGAPAWLRSGGVAVLEVAPHQAAQATAMAEEVGFREVQVFPDLAGRARALVARGSP